MTVYTLIDDDEMTLEVEYSIFGACLHCQIKKKWSKSVRRSVKPKIWRWINSLGPCFAVYVKGTHDPKLPKFISHMGGRYHHTKTTTSGEKVLFYQFTPLD